MGQGWLSLIGCIAATVALWVGALPCRTLSAGEVPVAYTPDAEIEQLINQALQSDGAVGERALKKLSERGPEAEKAIDWNLARAASNQRAKWVELYARLNTGKVAYRITLEMKRDGEGAIELWSNRTALAGCGRKFDRINGRPETTYSVEDLKYNPYSRVEMLKFFPPGDLMKHLEARVEQPGDIEARGMLTFRTFDALSTFASQFDAGGYHLLSGGTLTDAALIRTYSFRKPAETDRILYEKNLLLFHAIRWEFVFDFKGPIGKNNAHRTEGSKLIWTFNCYELLNGLASIQASFDAAGAPPRPSGIGASNANGFGDAPQAIAKKPSLNVKVFKRGDGPMPATKDLRERGCLVELDGRDSQPAGEGLQYRWRQTSGADLNIPTTDLARAYLCLIIKEAGEYRFELVVSKSGIYSQPAEVKIFVTDDAAPPQPVQPVNTAQIPPTLVRPPEKKPEPTPAQQTPPKTVAVAPVNPAHTPSQAKPPENKVPETKPPETKAPEIKPPDVAQAKPPEKKVPAGNAKELAAQGLVLLKAGSYAEAKKVLSDSVEIDAGDLDAQYNLGLVLMELGDFQNASRQFEAPAQSGKNAKAIMNVGHCFSRAGNLREAGNWYRRGAAVGRDQVEWEPRWQLGNNELRDKNYKEALSLLKEAEAMSSKVAAKDRDPRLYKDLAVAYFENKQPAEALKSVKIVQDLGYTADPKLVEDIRKALGTAGGSETKKPEPAPVAETKKPEPKPVEPPKTEVKKPDPVVAVAPVKNPNETKSPAPATPPNTVKTEPEKKPVAINEARPATPIEPTKAVTPEPKKEPKKVVEPKPVPPKRPLPPIPTEFDSALAAGKKAVDDAANLLAQNTENSKLEAHYKNDEAEAMLRAAWAKKPGDEQVANAFRELSKQVGTIALVLNTQIRAKVNGLVVLDAEPSIGPKDKSLYYVWEQVDGEPLEVRPEMLAQKRVGLRIRRAGTYKFDLAVSDGSRGGNPVSVTVEVSE